MDPIISFASGIVAAFTPCVIVLIPLLIYRFFQKDGRLWRSFAFFILGFSIFYILLSYVIASIFTSSVQNGFKAGLGLLFIILGILTFMDRLNPLNIPIVKNPFLLGVTFAIIAASNPCAIPYLSVVIAGSGKVVLLNILFFGLGVLTPAIVFAIIGHKLTNITKYTGRAFSIIDRLMSIILAASGIYLILSIRSLQINDVYVIGAMLLIIFVILMRTFFIINSPKELLKIRNILLILSLLTITAVSIYHCDITIRNYVLPLSEQTCGIKSVGSCPICLSCLEIFGIGAIVGLVAAFLIDRFTEKQR